MKARGLINTSSFEPETVEAMGQAFDDAWARIARMFDTNSVEIEAARMRLAKAMLSVATDGCTDVVALRADALVAMARANRSGRSLCPNAASQRNRGACADLPR
jgi:hypothetical protein